MAEKRVFEKLTPEAAKLWLAQHQHKLEARSGSASFAPHTPPAQRTTSTFSSPGSILAKEEDVVVVELTPRYLLAGLDGESGPQCKLSFGPEENRRVGDYRVWLPGYKRKHETLESWGREYELWRNRTDDVDLGVLSDVLERTMREAYNNHLLVDAGTSRLVLVLPSLVPHPVLETVLSTLFQRWKYPSITLLPAPTTAVVAAGLRSGLIIDLGWEESTVTSIYEYREIAVHRSTRARKRLTREMATMLTQTDSTPNSGHPNRFDLELVEELLSRTLATLGIQSTENKPEDVSNTSEPQSNGSSHITTSETSPQPQWPGQVEIDTYTIPRNEIIQTVLTNYLGDNQDAYPDDHEIPIPDLIYNNLLSLPPDVRGTCMSRVMFTGHEPTPLLRHAILDNVTSKISQRGWNSLKRNFMNPTARHEPNETVKPHPPPDAKHNVSIPTEKDYVEEKLHRQKTKLAQSQPLVQGLLREVHTLGSWTGASLLTSLRIRGFVELERERFLSHGLPTTSARDGEGSVVPQGRVGGGKADRSSWTLGGWG